MGFYRISWHPDGSKVDPGYYAGSGGMPHKICWVDPDGSPTQTEHDLTPLSNPSWYYAAPDISRDGTKIVFEHYEGHSWVFNDEIYIGDLSLDGNNVSNIVRLTTNSETDLTPSLSSDNAQIIWAYETVPWSDSSDLWMMNVDGCDKHPLTSNFTSGHGAMSGVFSYFGDIYDPRIIFSGKRGSNYNIWMIDAVGRLMQLTNTSAINELAPDFISFPSVTIFDTGSPANPYLSISGTHKGTIKPNHTVIATKLYTYPCAGTGGHTEYARIWNKTWNATVTWDGCAGDWHNITFDKPVVLLPNKTYNYTIRTGSYPQIHHTDALPTKNGWINCSEFVDANGKVYYDWIPAIMLWS